MKIFIAADHVGFELKETLKTYLSELGLGYEMIDQGPFAYDPNDDYPDFVTPLAESVVANKGSFGIIIGGSGQGEAMCANRISGVRAAVFYSTAEAKEAIDVTGQKSIDPYEIIKLARIHNNANILSLSMRFLSADEIKFAIELFLKTEFKGEERHARRLAKF